MCSTARRAADSDKKAFREISVEGCEIIGKGGHGTVYRLDGDTIVKFYGDKEPFDEIEREISYSNKAFVYGIPTAISFDIVKCGDCYGVVFELINADTLSNRICAEPEKLDDYSVKYSALVKKLHETEADTNIFGNIKDLYNKWVDDLEGVYTPDELAVLHEVINSIPDSNKFVHGDIYPKNIMVQDGELLFIDMADLTYGHLIFDYAGVALTHVFAKAYAKHLFGVDGDLMEILFNNMLKANFPARTDEELEKIKNVTMGYAGIILIFNQPMDKSDSYNPATRRQAPLQGDKPCCGRFPRLAVFYLSPLSTERLKISIKYSITPAVNKNQDPKLVEAIVTKAKEQIIPNAKRLIGAIDF